MAAKYADIRGRKLAEASAHVNDLLLQASAGLNATASRPGSSLADINAQLQQFLEQYSRSAAGPTKWLKLSEFLRGTYPAVAERMMAQQQQAAGAELERVREELAATTRQAQQHRQRAEQVRGGWAAAMLMHRHPWRVQRTALATTGPCDSSTGSYSLQRMPTLSTAD